MAGIRRDQGKEMELATDGDPCGLSTYNPDRLLKGNPTQKDHREELPPQFKILSILPPPAQQLYK